MLIRQTSQEDYFTTENLTREAFWNVYKPGCDEHCVLHKFRRLDNFIHDLDLVGIADDKIVAHIMYFSSELRSDEGSFPVVGFGPVSVLPELQGKGYGSEIIRYSLKKAADLGYLAVLITGNPDYYHRFGFESASRYGIAYAGMPEGDEAPFFMVKWLNEEALPKVPTVYSDPDGYFVTPEEVEEFDKQFPAKIKEKRAGQLF